MRLIRSLERKNVAMGLEVSTTQHALNELQLHTLLGAFHPRRPGSEPHTSRVHGKVQSAEGTRASGPVLVLGDSVLQVPQRQHA